MNSATTTATATTVVRPPTLSLLRAQPPPPPPPPRSNSPKPNLPRIHYKPTPSNSRFISTRSLQTTHPNHHPPPPPPLLRRRSPNSPTVADKLQSLVSEFKSLPEPIDRVKRLLYYANLLPEVDESRRIESNRVTGCTAQVWLEVAMDDHGAMRFRVDSDSEITKGFCYCLIWLLDGAAAGDVLEIKVDDLGEMNVGILPIKASSRVNTWHNVLISMRRRTQALIMADYGNIT